MYLSLKQNITDYELVHSHVSAPEMKFWIMEANFSAYVTAKKAASNHDACSYFFFSDVALLFVLDVLANNQNGVSLHRFF